MVEAGGLDGWLARCLFGPPLRLLCGLTGRSNFWWARGALGVGVLALAAATVLGFGIFGGGALAIVIVWFGSHEWAMLSRLEQAVERARQAPGLPVAILAVCAAFVAMRRVQVAGLPIGAVILVLCAGDGGWPAECASCLALAQLGLLGAAFWATDFRPAGLSLARRVAARWRRPLAGVSQPLVPEVG
jgi:hypothetical protein